MPFKIGKIAKALSYHSNLEELRFECIELSSEFFACLDEIIANTNIKSLNLDGCSAFSVSD